MIILSIECSTKVASVNLSDATQSLGTEVSPSPKNHTEFLNQAIQKLLEKNKLTANQIQKVHVSTGPGSFTGIRVGIALAKTLSFAIQAPIYSVNTLHLISQSANEYFNFQEGNLVLTVLNAQKNMVFWAVYQTQEKASQSPLFTKEMIEISPPQCCLIENLSDVLKTLPAFQDFINATSTIPVYEEPLEKIISKPASDILEKSSAPNTTINKKTVGNKNLFVCGDGLSLVIDNLQKNNIPFSGLSSPTVHPNSFVLSQISRQWAKNSQPIDWKMLHPLYIRESEAEENLKNRQKNG